jgi:hypothetical protein
MLITLGDFRQVTTIDLFFFQIFTSELQNAPVVRYGGRTAITKASICTQPIFTHFEIHQLHTPIPICQSSDPDFAKFLNNIGDDYIHDSVDLGRLPHCHSVNTVLDFVFPHDIVSQPLLCVNHAILSPFNIFVDEFNSKILERLPGESRTYWSTDYIETDLDEDDVQHSIATPELLNSFDEPGIPGHELTLKKGSICRFTRNFDASKGLTKNTRVIITNLLKYSVEVQTLPNVIAGHMIPSVIIFPTKIPFSY